MLCQDEQVIAEDGKKNLLGSILVLLCLLLNFLPEDRNEVNAVKPVIIRLDHFNGLPRKGITDQLVVGGRIKF